MRQLIIREIDGIIDSLKKAPSGTAQKILYFLMKGFKNFVGNKPLQDDFTIVVIRKKNLF